MNTDQIHVIEIIGNRVGSLRSFSANESRAASDHFLALALENGLRESGRAEALMSGVYDHGVRDYTVQMIRGER